MNAFELKGTTPDGKTASLWACGKCMTTRPYQTEEEAKTCCAPRLCACGAELNSAYGSTCPACNGKAAAEREQKVFDKAKKVAWSEYSGEWLCIDDRYFPDLDSLLDHYDGEEPDCVPTWAWGCETEKLSAPHAEDVLSNMLESAEWFEDAQEWASADALKALDEALDRLAAEIPEAHFEDRSTVVTFEKEAADRRASAAKATGESNG